MTISKNLATFPIATINTSNAKQCDTSKLECYAVCRTTPSICDHKQNLKSMVFLETRTESSLLFEKLKTLVQPSIHNLNHILQLKNAMTPTLNATYLVLITPIFSQNLFPKILTNQQILVKDVILCVQSYKKMLKDSEIIILCFKLT